MIYSGRPIRRCAGTQFDPVIAGVFIRVHQRGEMLLPYTMALKYTTGATKR